MSCRVKLKIVIVKLVGMFMQNYFVDLGILKNAVSILSVSYINTDICGDRIH